MWPLHGKPQLMWTLVLIIWTACIAIWKYGDLMGVWPLNKWSNSYNYVAVTSCFPVWTDTCLARPTETDFNVNQWGINSEITCSELVLEPKTCCTWMNPKGTWFNTSCQYFYWVFWIIALLASSCAIQWPIMERSRVGWTGRYSMRLQFCWMTKQHDN